MSTFNFSNELNHLINDLKKTDIKKISEYHFEYSSQQRIYNIIETGNTLILRQLNKQNDLKPENFQYIKNALVYTLALSLIISPKLNNNMDKLKLTWNTELNNLRSLLLKKNADYGSSYMKVAEKLGVCTTFSVRILDKCNRLEEISSTHNIYVTNETAVDTINDLIGYYILFLLALRETKLKKE